MAWSLSSLWSQSSDASSSATSNAQQSPQASSAAECPVDHKTRQAWLDKARAQNPPTTGNASPIPQGEACDSSQVTQSPSSNTAKPIPRTAVAASKFSLDQSREISTIPRAQLSPPDPGSQPRKEASPPSPYGTASHGSPANNEEESGPHTSGNWIYPSEQMFFNAMKRKSFDPQPADMRTIVPIHNAVNERAWAEIKNWEKGQGAENCGGPKLVSFSGNSKDLTPRARWNTLMGYTEPFDRHDWVVDRCGKSVEYVIDFYAGKDDGRSKGLNFYLDVRPKLNTWEGVRMRASRFVGLS